MDALGPPAANSNIQSVILADDDRDDHDFFRDALQEVNSRIRVLAVENGSELLHTLSHYVPDLLFLDLEMPLKNGLECLEAIRNNPNTKDLPVVVFSSTTRSVNIDTAYDMGADLFFYQAFYLQRPQIIATGVAVPSVA